MILRSVSAPMRLFHVSRGLRRWQSLSKNVVFRSHPHIASSMASRRRYSTEEESKPISWAQHPLKPATSTSNGIHRIPEATTSAANSHVAYVALGSNVGNRVAMIEKACNEMSSKGIKVKRTSGLWETEPMYVLDQEKFLNGVCEVS